MLLPVVVSARLATFGLNAESFISKFHQHFGKRGRQCFAADAFAGMLSATP